MKVSSNITYRLRSCYGRGNHWGIDPGFGRACAVAFVARGAKVIATARREQELLDLQRELGAESCAIVACDVVDTCALSKGISSALKGFGLGGDGESELSGIDVLVNNAGLALGLSLQMRAR